MTVHVLARETAMTHMLCSHWCLSIWLCVIPAILSGTHPGYAAEWIQVGEGRLFGISGMALVSQQPGKTELLVVHDNKGPAEPRLTLVTAAPEAVRYAPLTWPAGEEPPADLESASADPDRPGHFLVATSQGQVFRLVLAGAEVQSRGSFFLPGFSPLGNIEGFSVQRLFGRLVAVWGDRGSGARPGRLRWGQLDLESGRVNHVSSMEITVPYPPPSDSSTRHISDLKLDAVGIVWACAARDPGDSGPFASAVYALGVLGLTSTGDIQLVASRELTRLWSFTKKVEALEMIPGPSGGIAFASDDEDAGGWLFF